MNKNFNLLLLISLSLLLLFSSCEKELYEEAINPPKNGSIKEIKFDELLKETKFRNLFESVSNNSVLNRSTFENQNGFTIANENVKIIQTDSLISYTMLIYRDSVSNGSYFENLVIQQDIFDNQNAAIFKYTPNQIIPTGHNSFQFEGYVHKQNINFTGFNRTTNQNVTQSDCYVDQLMCSENWLNAGTSGPVHSATGSCRNINFLFVKRRQVICPDDGGSTGGGGIDDGYWSGDNNPNDGGFGNTGGGGGFDSESTIPLEYLPNTDDVVTSPILNNENSLDIRNAGIFYRSLSYQQQQWANDNQSSYNQLIQYQIDNNWSDESREFAEELIDLAIENNATFNFDNTIEPSNSLVFNTIQDFENHLETNLATLEETDFEIDAQNQRTATAKLSYGTFGITIRVKQNMFPTYEVVNVSSIKTGLSILLSYEQTDYNLDIVGSYVNVDVYGLATTGIKINVPFEANITFENDVHFRVVIDKNTGHVITAYEIND